MSFSAGSMLAQERYERLAAASKFEGTGSIINEWYSKAEYTTRRLGFLSNLPEYKAAPNLLGLVKSDADEIFELGQPALSAQRVRLRELDFAIDPLLPLATSENTQTLDDFRGYPASEWTPGIQVGTHRVFPSSPFHEASEILLGSKLPRTQPTAPTSHPTETTATHDQDSSELQIGASRPAIGSLSSASALLMGSVSSTALDKAKSDSTSTQPGPSPTEQTANNVIQNPAPARLRDATADPMEIITVPGLKNPPTRAELDRVLQRLAQPSTEAQAQQAPLYAAEDGVGSVTRRPLNVPVKVARQTKHAGGDGETIAAVDGSSSSVAPATTNSEHPLNKRSQTDGPGESSGGLMRAAEYASGAVLRNDSTPAANSERPSNERRRATEPEKVARGTKRSAEQTGEDQEAPVATSDSERRAPKKIKINVSNKPSRETKRKAPDDEDDEPTSINNQASKERGGRTFPEPTSQPRSPSQAVSETTEAADDSAEESPPPPKKKSSKSTSAKATTKRQDISAIKKTKPAPPKGKGKGRIATPAPAATSSQPPNNQSNPARLHRIAAGAILPTSKPEATEAQALRRQLLLAAFTRAHPRARHPDLMPEFWAPQNAKPHESADDGLIRCLCGATADTGVGGEWIACANDACGHSWQHVGCLGGREEAVSQERAVRESEDYEYECHLCDPFRHRHVLKGVRKRGLVVGRSSDED